MPTISLTVPQMIQRIAGAIGDDIHGVVTGGTTTAATVTGEPALLGANQLQGAEITVTDDNDDTTQTRRLTAHSVSAGVATLTVGSGSTVWTAPAASDPFEIHRIGGRGYERARYLDAINAAILSMADGDFTDLSNVSMAIEHGGQSGTGRRWEYPMPSGFNYLWGVDVLARRPVTAHRTTNLTTFRALGDAAARTRLGQGVKVGQQTYVSYIAVYMGTVGSPTDNLTCVVETDSSDVPSTTAVTNGTSATVAYSTLQARPRYVVFTFDPPMLLAKDTQYHLTLRRSGSVSTSNYYRVGEDGDGTYGDGALSLYGGASWSAVAGSDLIFAVSPGDGEWVEYAPANWEYRSANSDQLRLRKLPAEGVPLRLRGGAAIALVSAEADIIPARPDYIEQYALAWLARGRTGRNLADNYGQLHRAELEGLGIVPPARRSLPANSVRIR